MASIRSLPTNVVHLIAAGEVIDSLAAVVRELAENAIDAGATRLAIALWPNQWRVRVADNGNGMTIANLKRAALPHSTSKIHSSDNLWQITSLGFRGEALHSLAQLATLEICSREPSAKEGWRVEYDHQGRPAQVHVAAIAPGTIVTVSDLFARWLNRRDGLPPLAQQLRAVQLTIHQLALCHPHITWQVEQNDRPWFTLYSSTTAKQLLPQILKDVQPSDLQETQQAISLPQAPTTDSLQASPNGYPVPNSAHLINTPSLYLLIGLPDRCHRHRPDWVKVAVNGRCVQLPEIEQVILASFRRTLPRDRHPICFVHLHVPANHIDWNRHPAKTEVYLHHLTDWQRWVSQAIDQSLSARLSTQNQRVTNLLTATESRAGYQVNRQIVAPDSDSILHPSLATPRPLLLRALAQVHNTYILAEHTTGLWLVEQHIAHERVLYEQLCDRWQLAALPTPIILSHLTPAQVEQLHRLELEVEAFGDQLWAVRTAPAMLATRSDCPEALIELSLGGDLESALVATACRSAIRNGTPLALADMQTLLDQWQQTRNPRTCPHGRPIYLALEETALSRFFRRHWVIGKSHGI